MDIFFLLLYTLLFIFILITHLDQGSYTKRQKSCFFTFNILGFATVFFLAKTFVTNNVLLAVQFNLAYLVAMFLYAIFIKNETIVSLIDERDKLKREGITYGWKQKEKRLHEVIYQKFGRYKAAKLKNEIEKMLEKDQYQS